MLLALGIFALAALGGLTMAIIRLRGKPTPPLPIAIVHGLAAATGLVILVFSLEGTSATSRGAGFALVCLLAAALGGFVMLFQHLKRHRISVPLMLVHALAAVTGVVALWLSL
ncbi:MAG: hypothetical protein ACOY0T_38305 [Myxococcota bacterium]